MIRLVELIGIEPTTSSMRSKNNDNENNGLNSQDPAIVRMIPQRVSNECGRIAVDGFGAFEQVIGNLASARLRVVRRDFAISPAEMWRLLMAISRDSRLEASDVRVAAEFVDLIASERAELDLEALALRAGLARVALCNSLSRLVMAGWLEPVEAKRGAAGGLRCFLLGFASPGATASRTQRSSPERPEPG